MNRRENILDDIRSTNSSVDDKITAAMYRENGKYSVREIQNKFGSWNEAKKKAGVGLNYPHRKPNTKTTEEKRRMVEQIKKRVGCINCGYKKHTASLQFHHISGEKVNGIGRMVYSYSWQSICDEIKKCVVLCANCHAAVTNGYESLSK